jgi:hypothetical protein
MGEYYYSGYAFGEILYLGLRELPPGIIFGDICLCQPYMTSKRHPLEIIFQGWMTKSTTRSTLKNSYNTYKLITLKK